MTRRKAFDVLNTVIWNFIENEIDKRIYELEETISMETLFDTETEKRELEELKQYDKQVLRNVRDEMRMLMTAKNISWINEKEEYKTIKEKREENCESLDFWVHKNIKMSDLRSIETEEPKLEIETRHFTDMTKTTLKI